jgi:hypothetical protein
VAGQQVADPFGIEVAAGQSGVGATPATPVRRLQAQVGNRWDRRRAQQRIGQLQQGVGAASAAGVQLGAEGPELAEKGSRLGHDRAA